MATLVRAVLAGVVFVATYCFVYWLPGSFLPGAIAFAAAIVCALLATRHVWARTAVGAAPGSPAFFAGLGALIVGGVGFVLGFFGPMLLTPEANQGPLLGLFITGPGGAVLGAVGGFLYGMRRRAATGRG